MRKIGILKPIIIGMFIILMLPACEKDTVDVTEHHTANESDKPLEKESGVNLKSFEGGAMFIADNYVDVDLHQGYYFKRFLVYYSIGTESEPEFDGYIRIPINFSMGSYDEDVFFYIFLEVCKQDESDRFVKFLGTASYPYQTTPEVHLNWKNCKAIGEDGNIEPFTDYMCDMGRIWSLTSTYLQEYISTTHEGCMKKIRIAHSRDYFEVKSMIVNNEYTFYDSNLVEGEFSGLKIYMGWKDLSKCF
ncbi:MAG: hypothetical protein N4A72_14970 [Bacteroidales bacterium]|jgi:predicted secreted protein|nr:hypothetical protein [Bacteroidales bacterium]